MNILRHFLNMYTLWEEKMGITLWKAGVKESKISNSKYTFLLQNKRRKKRRHSQACLGMKSKFASLSSGSSAQFWKQPSVYLSESQREPSLWIHCDRSTTNWSKHASSPLNTWLPAPLMCIERLVTCIQLQPLHLNSLDLFLVWSEKQASFFFLFTSKPPRRGWLHGIHHHASLMTSGQEHGVKSQ